MKSKLIKNVPRRAVMDEWTEEERKIQDLVWDIEKLGAHSLLTDAVILLGQAKDKLADWIELDK